MVLILTNLKNTDTFVIGNEMTVASRSTHIKMSSRGTYVDHQQVVPWEDRAVRRGKLAGDPTMVGTGGNESGGQILRWRPWEGYDDNFFYYLSRVD